MKSKTRRGITPKYKLHYTVRNASTGEFVISNRKFNISVWNKDLAIAIDELDNHLYWLYQDYFVSDQPKTKGVELLGIKLTKYIKSFLQNLCQNTQN
jgi:hypothetical protein